MSLRKLREQIDSIDVSADYLSYTNDDEICQFVYNISTDIKIADKIKYDLNIKSENELYDILSNGSDKEVENVFNYLAGYISEWLDKQDDETFINFTLNNAGIDDDLALDTIFDYMVETQQYQQNVKGLLDIADYVSPDDIAELDRFIESAKAVNKEFNKNHLYKVLSGFIPLL